MYGTVIREDRATPTGNMYRKFCDVRACVFETSTSSQTGRKTDRHTDTPIAILRPRPSGEAIMTVLNIFLAHVQKCDENWRGFASFLSNVHHVRRISHRIPSLSLTCAAESIISVLLPTVNMHCSHGAKTLRAMHTQS